MKKIIHLALLLTISFIQYACIGNANTKTSTGIATETNAYTINDCFKEMLLSSNFPLSNDIPKDKIQVDIDSQENNVYLCRVYFETEGTGTLGWIKYDSVHKKLYNVTYEDPVELCFEMNWANKLNRILNDTSGNEVEQQDIISQTENISDEKCSVLPFDFEKYFEEYLSKEYDEVSEEVQMRYCEYNFEENKELRRLFSSKWEYHPSAYMILDKNENFILYLFRASNQEDEDTVLVSILATVKGGNLISSLNLNTVNAGSTFVISKDLVISIYKTSTKEMREADENGSEYISKKDSLIAEYVIDLNGKILQKQK